MFNFRSLTLSCFCLWVSGCSAPFTNVNMTPIRKPQYDNSAFFDSAYSYSDFDVSGIFLNPGVNRSADYVFCVHNESADTLRGFRKYIANAERMIDLDVGYGLLFAKQAAAKKMRFGSSESRIVKVIPDFDAVIKFDGQKMFKECNVFVGKPKEVIKVKRFIDKLLLGKPDAQTPSYYILGRVVPEYTINEAAPIPSVLERVTFEEKILRN